MEVFTDKKDILNCLKKIQGITERSSITPITSSVLIEAKNKTVVVSATNFEVGIVTKYKAKIIKEGRIVVDAKKVYEIIKEMPEGEIRMVKKDSGWAEISCEGKIVFNLAGQAEEEFPPIEIDSKIKFLEINAKSINELIRNTVYASSNDETRETLQGVLLEKKKKGLRMVATDGHRLALADRTFSDNEELIMKGSVVIPQKGAREIKRLIEEMEKEEKIKIGLGEKSVVVVGGEETMVVRLIEGEFPNYKKVIPNDNKNRMVVKTKELIESLRRVSLVTEEDTRAVRFVVKSGELTILSKKIGLGDAREERKVDYKGEDMEIGLNGRYLLDILNVMGGDEVVLEMMDEKTPILIKGEGKDHTIAVIMPMML